MFHLELLQLALYIPISSEICTFGSIMRGLLVFLFFKPQVRMIINYAVHVDNQLNKIYFAIFVLLYTNLVRKHTEVLDVVNLWFYVQDLYVFA